MIREDGDAMRELGEQLLAFAYSYNAQLQQAGQIDNYNPQAQKYLEAYESLKQDFDVWVGQISFGDALELQAMWNNREIWPRRLASLPPIEAPRQEEEQEPTPELPMMPGVPGAAPIAASPGVPSAALSSVASGARAPPGSLASSSGKSSGKGRPPSSGGAPPPAPLPPPRDPPHHMNPVTHTRIPQPRRMPHHQAHGYGAGYGIPGAMAAPAAEMDFSFAPGRRS